MIRTLLLSLIALLAPLAAQAQAPLAPAPQAPRSPAAPPPSAAPQPRPAGKVTGKVTVTEADGRAAAGAEVIVYVVGFKEPPAKTTATIRQQGRRFVPDLVAITAGDRVVFPNNDPFLHNVFSHSPARQFDLGSYRRGDQKDKDFPDPGVVDVYCNIHPEMAATILVLPNRRHTRAGSDGRFVLDGVPPGTWTVFAYTRRAVKPASAKVTVAAGAAATVNLSIVRGAKTEHLNKYGTPYTPGTSYP
jgi:plastocyanin